MRKHYFVFAAKYKGNDIFDEQAIFGHEIERSGISYSEEYQWSKAGQWGHYTHAEFEKASPEERGYVIAMYLVEHQTQAVLAEDERIRIKREEKLRQAQQSRMW